jgi:predicted acyl esterase
MQENQNFWGYLQTKEQSIDAIKQNAAIPSKRSDQKIPMFLKKGFFDASLLRMTAFFLV